jgi:hypothetical protein
MSKLALRKTGRQLRATCGKADLKLLDLTYAERRRYYKPIAYMRRLAEECRLKGF